MKRVSDKAYAATPEARYPRQQTTTQLISEIQARASCQLFEPDALRKPLDSLPEVDNRPYAPTPNKRSEAQVQALERIYDLGTKAGIISEGEVPRYPTGRRLSTPEKLCQKKSD